MVVLPDAESARYRHRRRFHEARRAQSGRAGVCGAIEVFGASTCYVPHYSHDPQPDRESIVKDCGVLAAYRRFARPLFFRRMSQHRNYFNSSDCDNFQGEKYAKRPRQACEAACRPLDATSSQPMQRLVGQRLRHLRPVMRQFLRQRRWVDRDRIPRRGAPLRDTTDGDIRKAAATWRADRSP